MISKFTAFLIFVLIASPAIAHDPIHPELNDWYSKLQSRGGGPCCSQSDGKTVDDPDWEAILDESKPEVHFRVRIEGEWVDVPDDKVLTEPNRAGRTIVWPYYMNGHPVVRCFIPGTMG